MRLLFIILLISTNSVAQSTPKLLNGFIKVDFLGFEYPLFLNNSYSKELSKNKGFVNYANLKFSWFVNNKKSIGIGLNLNSFVHDFDLDRIKKEINLNGIMVYGDMWLHDWTEYRIGPDFSYIKRVSDIGLFDIHLSSGITLSSRGIPVLIYEDPNKFIYPKWKPGFGSYFDIDINYFFLLSEAFHNLGAGVGFEMAFGNVKTEYEVRYGQGADLNVYDSYNYKHNYIIWRYGFSFKLRADLTLFKGND